MIFGSRWWEACGLLIRKYLVMSLVLSRDSSLLYAFLLSLFLALNSPFLSEMCLTDFDPLLLLLISLLCHSYFFQPDSFANECSFFPIDCRIELSQPRIPQDDAILSQVGDIEALGELPFSSSYTENTGFANNPPLVFCAVHVIYFAGLA
jgi:hypothetical protein